MSNKIYDNGTFVTIHLHGGPDFVAAWEVIERAYGKPIDRETLYHIVRKVENSSGYAYMTTAERETEFWKELNESLAKEIESDGN